MDSDSKPSDQYPNCFPLCLKIYAYDWDDAGEKYKLGRNAVHKIFSRTRGEKKTFKYVSMQIHGGIQTTNNK